MVGLPALEEVAMVCAGLPALEAMCGRPACPGGHMWSACPGGYMWSACLPWRWLWYVLVCLPRRLYVVGLPALEEVLWYGLVCLPLGEVANIYIN